MHISRLIKTYTLVSCIALALIKSVYASDLTNGVVTIHVDRDGTLSFINGVGTLQRFQPRFTVFRRQDDPGKKIKTVKLYDIPAWAPSGQAKANLDTDPFLAGTPTELSADQCTVANGVATWHFPDQADFKFEASVHLERGSTSPLVEFHLVANTPGWYSVAYTGAPQLPPEQASAIWQPMLWCERRFPESPILSTENMCPLPATFVEHEGITVGVAANPAELPFRLPTRGNALCGVALRDTQGQAHPMFFAPVLGRPGSQLNSGSDAHFSFLLIAQKADWYETLRDLATGPYNLNNDPEDFGISLNQTMENEIAFAMDDDKSGWLAEYKGFDYKTDVPDTVKVVSALDPLSIAIVTNDESIWQRRAQPMTEYMLSRAKYLFSIIHEHSSSQGGVRTLDGPTGEVFEWASLSDFANGRCAAFTAAAQERFDHPRALNLSGAPPPDGAWINSLAMYRMTGDARWLNQATAGALDYIKNRIDAPPTDFSGLVSSAQFWTDYGPRWHALMELYQTTGDKRFLAAAAYGAHLYGSLCWTSPPIPKGDVDIDGQSTPAWRVSQIGLVPEASNTAGVNPAVFMSMHAPWFLRMAYLNSDPFLQMLARHAVIGRYANFPGYTLNGKFSLAYTTLEYPLNLDPNHPKYTKYHKDSPIYFPHVWPHIAMLMDYLMSEAWARSATAVNFASEYAQGYVYLQSNVYGSRSGTFYGDSGVIPYMPAGLATFDSPQINYVAGRNDKTVYFAFMNESAQPLHFRATIDPTQAGCDSGKVYPCRVWKENVAAAPAELRGGTVELDIAPHGITAIAVDGATPAAVFQRKVSSPEAPHLGPGSLSTIDTPFGPVHAGLISFGKGLTSAYLWTTADEKKIVSAHLQWRPVGGQWQQLDDVHYPFEFSVPLDEASRSWEFEWTGQGSDGLSIVAPPITLKQ